MIIDPKEKGSWKRVNGRYLVPAGVRYKRIAELADDISECDECEDYTDLCDACGARADNIVSLTMEGGERPVPLSDLTGEYENTDDDDADP